MSRCRFTRWSPRRRPGSRSPVHGISSSGGRTCRHHPQPFSSRWMQPSLNAQRSTPLSQSSYAGARSAEIPAPDSCPEETLCGKKLYCSPFGRPYGGGESRSAAAKHRPRGGDDAKPGARFRHKAPPSRRCENSALPRIVRVSTLTTPSNREESLFTPGLIAADKRQTGFRLYLCLVE